MEDQLVDFLRSRKQRATSQEIDWQAKKDDWIGAVKNLYAHVEEMLRDSTVSKDVAIRRYDIEMAEDFIGTYSIPVLETIVGSERVEFRPKGRYGDWRVGPRGHPWSTGYRDATKGGARREE